MKHIARLLRGLMAGLVLGLALVGLVGSASRENNLIDTLFNVTDMVASGAIGVVVAKTLNII